MFLERLKAKHESIATNVANFAAYCQVLDGLNMYDADQYILTDSGKVILLAEYQKLKGLHFSKVANYFSLTERHLNDPFILAEPLLIIADALREKRGRPVVLNSAFRSEKKQLQLKAQGFKAATFSPHCLGLAVDFGCSSRNEVLETVDFLQDISKKLNIPVRLGFTQYLKLGQTFVHCDVAPYYFGENRIFNSFIFDDIKQFSLTVNW